MTREEAICQLEDLKKRRCPVLEPTAGRMSEEIMPECDIMCHLAWEN